MQASTVRSEASESLHQLTVHVVVGLVVGLVVGMIARWVCLLRLRPDDTAAEAKAKRQLARDWFVGAFFAGASVIMAMGFWRHRKTFSV